MKSDPYQFELQVDIIVLSPMVIIRAVLASNYMDLKAVRKETEVASHP